MRVRCKKGSWRVRSDVELMEMKRERGRTDGNRETRERKRERCTPGNRG